MSNQDHLTGGTPAEHGWPTDLPAATGQLPAITEHKRRGRRWALVIAAVAGVSTAGIIAVAVAGAGGAEGTSQIGTSHAQAPAAHKPTLQDWLAGRGGDELTAVQDDLSAISDDADVLDADAMRTDGARLAADAMTARSDPPPGTSRARHYIAAMDQFIAAGNAAASGDWQTATAHTVAGGKQIQDVTALIP
jgi:hypothetical protein